MLVHCQRCGHSNHNVHCCDGMVASCEQGPAQPCERCGWDIMRPFTRHDAPQERGLASGHSFASFND